MTQISEDERISADVANQVGIAVESGIDFVSADAIRAAAQEAGRDAVATRSRWTKRTVSPRSAR